MFSERRIEAMPADTDSDGLKVYTISAHDLPVDFLAYRPRLQEMKEARPLAWRNTPSFAICHDGGSARYLTLAWWGNDNEMLVAVAVETSAGWVEDSERYSFCLWDMEVMWHERNAFVEHMYGAVPDLKAYRASRLVQG